MVPGGSGVPSDVITRTSNALNGLITRFSDPSVQLGLVAYHAVATGLQGSFAPASDLLVPVAKYSSYQEQGPLSLRDPLAGKRLRQIPPERASEPAGYATLADFSELHLLQLDACTKCGRCHEACPAFATGRPLSPRAVILDPTVTVHTPEWLWLSTGIRAVDHCVEGLCSREAHPYADAQALKGLSMLAHALPRVKAMPADLDARRDCQIGTWLSMGPLSAGVPMGASHGISYVLGAAFDVPHGYTSCVMLPSVMRWNKPGNAERQELVSAAMGHPGEDAAEVLDWFIRDLGMPRSLHEIKIGPEHFERIAEQAMATPWIPRNPRKIDGPAQVREILVLAA